MKGIGHANNDFALHRLRIRVVIALVGRTAVLGSDHHAAPSLHFDRARREERRDEAEHHEERGRAKRQWILRSGHRSTVRGSAGRAQESTRAPEPARKARKRAGGAQYAHAIWSGRHEGCGLRRATQTGSNGSKLIHAQRSAHARRGAIHKANPEEGLSADTMIEDIFKEVRHGQLRRHDEPGETQAPID